MPGSDLIAIVWPEEGFKTRLGAKNKVWNAFKIQVILPPSFFFFWFLLQLNFSDTHWPRLSCNESLVALVGLERRWCWFDLPVCPQLSHPEMPGSTVTPKNASAAAFPKKGIAGGMQQNKLSFVSLRWKKKKARGMFCSNHLSGSFTEAAWNERRRNT